MTTPTNPYTSPAAPLGAAQAGASLEVTWGRALRVWWSLIWRTLLASVLVGALFGAILGMLLGVAGFALGTIVLVTQAAGALVGIGVGVVMVRHVLRMSWREFRIVLIAVPR
jgi:hypothetical protein